MKIIKHNGSIAEYDSEKVRRSILKTGASKILVEAVLPKIEERLQERMTTKQLFEIVHEELKRENICFACRYNLREAILKLGPAGFKFEKYVSSILNAYGWKAHVPEDELEGSCVSHEVDVVAEKDNRRVFIEAKFRNKYRATVNLKDTMATWSRFLDLVDGSAVGKVDRFDEPWIVTNARFSDRARKFGICKGIHMVGWNFPTDHPFGEMVDHMSLYPVTVLDSLKQSELEAFSEHGLMLCKEIAEKESDELAEMTGIAPERAQELIRLCVKVIEGDKTRNTHR